MKDTVGCNHLVITLERSMEMTKHWCSQRSVVMVTFYWTLTIHHCKSSGLSESSQNKEAMLWRLWPSRVEYSVIQPPGCADSRGPGSSIDTKISNWRNLLSDTWWYHGHILLLIISLQILCLLSDGGKEILASDWSRLILWPGLWLVIGSRWRVGEIEGWPQLSSTEHWTQGWGIMSVKCTLRVPFIIVRDINVCELCLCIIVRASIVPSSACCQVAQSVWAG